MSESENLDRIGHAMMLAWQRVKKTQARMWGEWMTIGEGLLEGRRWAMQMAGTNKPEGKGYVVAYAEWLKRYKVDDMDKSDRAKLLQLMEERPAVEEWRTTLTDYERRNLNNPVMVWRKWTAATRVRKPRPRSAGVSASEHGRAQATVEQLQSRIEELEEELESARAVAADDTAQVIANIEQKILHNPGEMVADWGGGIAGEVARALTTLFAASSSTLHLHSLWSADELAEFPAKDIALLSGKLGELATEAFKAESARDAVSRRRRCKTTKKPAGSFSTSPQTTERAQEAPIASYGGPGGSRPLPTQPTGDARSTHPRRTAISGYFARSAGRMQHKIG